MSAPTSAAGDGPAPAMASFNEMLASRLVTVLVGPEKNRWTLHEALLTATAKFFNAAFLGPWKVNDGILELPEDNPAAFELFVRWMYTKHAAIAKPSLPSVGASSMVRSYLELYIFARKYDVEELSNQVIDGILDHFNGHVLRHPVLADLVYIADNTTSGDKMRALLCFFLTSQLLSSSVEGRLIPTDWVSVLESSPAVGIAILNQIQGSGWTVGTIIPKFESKNRCMFHVHVDGKVCPEENKVSEEVHGSFNGLDKRNEAAKPSTPTVQFASMVERPSSTLGTAQPRGGTALPSSPTNTERGHPFIKPQLPKKPVIPAKRKASYASVTKKSAKALSS